MFPELNEVREMFGNSVRRSMFRATSQGVDASEIHIFKIIARLYQNLAFLIVTALVCLRPRLWRDARKHLGQADVSVNEIAMLIKELN